MEIRRWLCFIIIKCFVIQCMTKSVSLNEIIAAESKDKQLAEITSELSTADSEAKPASLHKITTQSKTKRLLDKLSSRKGFPKRSSLSKRLASHGILNKFKTENTILGDKIISPFKYRKTFLIKSPLKPKKLKLLLKPRYKRKNQSTKREISDNVGLEHKYIPLLKSLSMLFDNLLDTDESNSYEIKRKTYKRNRYNFDEQFEPSFEQPSISNIRISKLRSQKKTTTSAPSISIEISKDTKSLASHEDNDYSTLRPHKSVPILFPRNTLSLRRDDNGPSQRSSATHNGDPEGDITRDYGDHKHNTGCAENESCTQGDENNPNSITRNDSSGIRHSRGGGNGDITGNTKNRERGITNSTSKDETQDTTGRNQYEMGRNETESKNILREPFRRLRGFVSENKTAHDEGLIPEPIRLEEVREETVLLDATHDSAGDQRIPHKDGPFPTEDEKISTRDETGLIERTSRLTGNYSQIAGKKRPVVLIFDGYSVTRDKNGENKVSGKTIHIHS